MKIGITGVDGLVGSALFETLAYEEDDLRPSGYSKSYLDITDVNNCRKVLFEDQPDLVVHCAAYTKVDQAEIDFHQAFLVNSTGTRNIAQCCSSLNIPIIYLSTDAVFNGESKFPYTIWDIPIPKSVYGQSKLQGELIVKEYMKRFYILRTNWIYGKGRTNFITSAIAKFKNNPGKVLDFPVIDQISTPTNVYDLCKAITQLIKANKSGIYHFTNEGSASRQEVIEFIGKTLDKQCTISQYQGIGAFRPKYCPFQLSDFGFPIPHWQDSLARFILEGS